MPLKTSPVPLITIHHQAIRKIMYSVGAMPPETGGILLGPIEQEIITDFYFDSTAECTGGTYTPDYVTLRKKMKNEWLPEGLDFKGFCHSHPGSLDELSSGDIEYIHRLFIKNPDMKQFVAPIVIPGEFRIRPIIVLRENPTVGEPTSFEII